MKPNNGKESLILLAPPVTLERVVRRMDPKLELHWNLKP
jgi:hypothetical protein